MRIFKNIIFIGLVFCALGAQAQDPAEVTISSEKEASAYEITNSEYFLIEATKFVFLEEYEKALVHLEKALELDKKNHAALFQKAEILVIQEKNKEALSTLEQAIELQKDNIYYYLLAAQINKEEGEIGKAALLYELMIDHVEGWEIYGEEIITTLTEAASYQKALALMPNLLNYYPNYPELYLKKAELETKVNKSKASVSTLAEAHDKFPEDVTVLNAYIKQLTQTGALKEAESLLQAEASENYKARILLLELLMSQNKTEPVEQLVLENFRDVEADLESKLLSIGYLLNSASPKADQIDSLQELLVATYPENPLVYENGGFVYDLLASQAKSKARSDFYAKAIASYKTSAQLNPNNFEAWLKVFDYELAQAQWTQLLDDVEYLLDLYPNQAILYYYYAEAYRGLEDIEEALALTNQGLRMGGRNDLLKSLLLSEKAKLFTLQNKNEQADALFNEALNTNKVDERAIYAYAVWLTDVNPKAATELIELFSTSLSRSAEWVVVTANAYIAQNELVKARALYESALNESPTMAKAELFERYGDLLFKTGDVDAALIQWQKALTLGGFSEELQEKIEKKSIN